VTPAGTTKRWLVCPIPGAHVNVFVTGPGCVVGVGRGGGGGGVAGAHAAATVSDAAAPITTSRRRRPVREALRPRVEPA
jgi:hypothetical protein